LTCFLSRFSTSPFARGLESFSLACVSFAKGSFPYTRLHDLPRHRGILCAVPPSFRPQFPVPPLHCASRLVSGPLPLPIQFGRRTPLYHDLGSVLFTSPFQYYDRYHQSRARCRPSAVCLFFVFFFFFFFLFFFFPLLLTPSRLFPHRPLVRSIPDAQFRRNIITQPLPTFL